MTSEDIDKIIKRLVELFYEQYIKEVKSGNTNSIEKIINKIR